MPVAVRILNVDAGIAGQVPVAVGDGTWMAGDIAGTVSSVTIAGALAGMTALQPDGNLIGSIAGIDVATVISGAWLGSIALQPGGNFVGTLDSVPIATVVLGAALGASALQAMPDASASVKGALKLAGDLAGTALVPLVAQVGGMSAVALAAGATLGASALQAVLSADGSSFGVIKLAGDLGGTASVPRIVQIDNIASSTITSGAALGVTAVQPGDDFNGTIAGVAASVIMNGAVLGQSSVQPADDFNGSLAGVAVATVVSAAMSGGGGGGGSAPDATTGIKGIVQLAGDFDGTASLPIVAQVGGMLASALAAGAALGASAVQPADDFNGTIAGETASVMVTGAARGYTAVQPGDDFNGLLGGELVSTVVNGAALGVTAVQPTDDFNGLLNGELTSTVVSGAALAATAVQPADDFNGTLAGELVATIVSGALLGASAVQPTDDFNGMLNGELTSTVVSGAALGATAVQPADDFNGTIAGELAATVVSGAALGTTAVQPTDDFNGTLAGVAVSTVVSAAMSGGGGGGGSAPDATTGIKGIVQLAGDLGGTAALPTVTTINSVAVATVTAGAALGATALQSVPDASGSVKGLVKLAGDFGGTAALPTVTQVGGLSAASVAAGAGLGASAVQPGSSPSFAALTLTSFSGVLKAAAGIVSAALIVNADVSATAGIVSTKLATAVQTSLGKADTALQPSVASIVAADISATAAIAKTQLAAAVQTSLGKADTALQPGVASIVNADVNAAAGIVSTKLSSAVQTSLGKADTALQAGAASIVNADISATAGIVSTKLAAAVQTSLGKADTALQPSSSAVLTALTLTGFSGVLKAAAGVLSASSIVSADISATAGIVKTQLVAAVQTSLGLADTSIQQSSNYTGFINSVSAVTVTAGAASGGTSVQPNSSPNFTNAQLTGYLSVGASPAQTGLIRIPHAQKIIGRNAGGSADLDLLDYGTASSQRITLGNTTSTVVYQGPASTTAHTFQCNSVVALTVGNTSLLSNVPLVSFAATVVSPSINQAVDATATLTGDTFLFAAQDCSGTTAVTAGKLITRPGNATGGSGTRNGGDAVHLVGTGATKNGNMSLLVEAAGYGGMATGLFIGNATVVPSSNPTSGGFLYSDAGTLKWRDPAGVVSSIGGASAPDATTLVKGIVQLAGDLGGTAALPTVTTINSVAVATVTAGAALGASALQSVPDASGSVKGVVKLAGDLAGTAALPTVATINSVAVATVTAGAALGATALQSVPDATTLIKGLVQLAGDLGGTSALPTVTTLNSVAVATVTAGAALGATALQSVPDASGSVKGVVKLAGDLDGTAALPTVALVGGMSAASVVSGAGLGASSVQPGSSPSFAALTLTSFSGVLKAAAGIVSAALIVSADINATAAIANTQLSAAVQTSLGKADTALQPSVASIVNADVNAAAAIAGSKIAPDFAAQNIQTTGTLSLGSGTRSSSGLINSAASQTVLGGRNTGNTADRQLISWTTLGTDILGFGDASVAQIVFNAANTSGHSFQTSGSTRFTITATAIAALLNVTLNAASLAYTSTVTSPVISQLVVSTATVTAQTLTITAQDASGTTAVTAGKLVTRPGNATGGSGTRTGGDAVHLVGTGATANGNMSLLVQAAGYGGMATGIFLANASVIPSSNPTSGGFLYSDAGTLKWRDPSGTVLIMGGAASGIVDANVDAAAAIAGSKIAPNFAAQNILTTGTCTLGTSPSATGTLALAHASSIKARNSLNTTDRNVIDFGLTTADVVTIGDSSTQVDINAPSAGVNVKVASTLRISFTASQVVLAGGCTTISFGANPSANCSITIPNTSSTTLRTLTIQGMSSSSVGTVTAGKLIIQAGISTGASGTRNGGDLSLLVGTGATANGNISLVTDGVGSFGGMSGGLFVGNCGAAPTTNPTAGGLLYSDAGALKWRGPSGAVTTIGAA